MTAFVIVFACGVFVGAAALIVVSACMLSSQRSQQEEAQPCPSAKWWESIIGHWE